MCLLMESLKRGLWNCLTSAAVKDEEMDKYIREKFSIKVKEIAFEKGMIEGWIHLRSVCNSCIKAHKEELKRIRRRDDKGRTG